MKSILKQIGRHFEVALMALFGETGQPLDPQIRPSGDVQFGDYQSNVAMGLAKKLGRKPREVARQIVDTLMASSEDMGEKSSLPLFSDLCEMPEIAGPGFINLRIKTTALEASLQAISPASEVDRLGIDTVNALDRDTVVVDYSSPNVAKQMHVGHLRSTIIGDTIARVLEFEGHEVVRQNHVGDWGTQFGIILEELHERGLLPRNLSASADAGSLSLPQDPAELEAIYRAGNAKMPDAAFADRARAAVTRLQTGDPAANLAWRLVTEQSMHGVLETYRRLGVTIDAHHTRGESFYNPLLAGLVKELQGTLNTQPTTHYQQAGALKAQCREDQGAVCVFLEKPDGSAAFKGPQGDPLPMLIQKSDGAYLYATTDLAAIAYRINDFDSRPVRFTTETLPDALRGIRTTPQSGSPVRNGGLGATRLLYVVGAPQKLHFDMLFATIRALGWTYPGDGQREVELEHVAFGSVLGEDRKMLRTRSGESVKLKDLLEEAVQRAEKLVRETEADADKRRGFTEEEINRIAEVVGISAVKYADLCQNRNTDYVFSWDKMLAMSGNTAPYMLYAYARIRSIHRKGADATRQDMSLPDVPEDQAPARVALAQPAERALAITILRLPEVIDTVAENLLPNFLCDYLYDLAGKFMTFYETCPVLQAKDDGTRLSRLQLCDLTARTLKLGLGLLGIPTLERM